MTIQPDKLRLHVTFLDELKRVQVIGAVNEMGVNICKMGIITRKESLQDLLEKASVDHYITCSGDIFEGNFKATAYKKNPRAIVQTLESGFRRADEIQEKILQGGTLTEEEKSFAVPISLWLCSSSLSTVEGLKRVHDWFEAAESSAAKPFEIAKKTGA